MYARNGMRRLRQLTKKPAGWSVLGNLLRMLPVVLPLPVRLAFVLMLLGLVLLLAGCATNSPPSVGAANPAPPKLSEPLPLESYSNSARKLMESWRNALIGM